MEGGTIKKLDDLGRITLPKEWRDALELSDHSPVEMYFYNGTISIQKYSRSCEFCTSKKNLITYNDKKICRECADKIARMSTI